MGTMTFQINDRSTGGVYPAVWVTITEQLDGSLLFNVSQDGAIVGDLRGIFFDVADESLLGSLVVVANSSDIRIGDDTIKDLGNSANMTGLLGSDGGYDVGIEIGTAGIGADDINSFTFTLSSTARSLSLTDFSQVDFAARLTSVGLIEGIRADSSKILEHTSSVILLTDANATVYENNAVTGSLLDGVNLPGSNTVTDWTGGALGQVVDLWSDGDQIATLRVDGDGNYVLDASAGDELSDGEEIRFDYTFAARNQDESTSWSTDSAAFIVKVIGVNDGPDAQDDEGGEVLEGQVLVGDVTGNDSDVDRLDTHVWTLMDGSFTGQGLVTLNPDGTWTFDSQGAYAGMVDGERQELSFQYVMTDNHGASDVATVTFYVNGDGSGGGGGGGGGGGDDDPPPLGNDFPTWGQDISNITLIFMQTAGDIKPLSDGDGYYTVKVNVDSAFNDDLDASIDQLISDLVAYDANLDPNPDLYGVVIKGGLQTTLFYAYGDYNFNGDATDTLPGDLGFVLPGDNANVSPTHAIDAGYNYTALILS